MEETIHHVSNDTYQYASIISQQKKKLPSKAVMLCHGGWETNYKFLWRVICVSNPQGEL